MARIALINGYVIRNGEITKQNLVIEQDRIIKLTTKKISDYDGEIIDVEGNYVCPGFIDIHTHGGFNIDINHATTEDLKHLSSSFASQGTTSFLMSIVTDKDEKVIQCINSFKRFKNQEVQGAEILGIHLEGPYLSHEFRGSMPEHLLVPYDHQQLKKFQEIAKGDIKYITVAPEVQGVLEHIPDMLSLGMTVSIGHSGASFDVASEALSKGVQCCTHTFNAMRLFHQHEPAIMGAVLNDRDCYCEAICDGLHLHPGTVNMLLNTKGWDRVIAITDSIMAAGLPDGQYQLGANKITVIDGDAKLLHENVRAGSTLTMCQALKNIMKFTNAPVEKAIKLMSENPAKMLGIYDKVGSLDIGKLANIVILDKEFHVESTFVRGKKVFS